MCFYNYKEIFRVEKKENDLMYIGVLYSFKHVPRIAKMITMLTIYNFEVPGDNKPFKKLPQS